ncbi:anti-anti-sigma factor [Alloyangia pacifica]|uniref:Anti-sigma factor antagonist n=1 Tax=Alloyangia pacifica TaxID=311180 RepID=A0A2U8HGJ3_9RHOB|nr:MULTISPECIES: STAS domain-containing protein [Roseobacteraceae]AWI84146.1 anti-anti-sigma factor [Alloyangia pacifica]NDV48210.1 STAS domain-containing protein [Salipiger sp. PrR003]NDW35438.1 STAS domain-containing protein [Salipiger sp. PrR007]
MKLTCRGTEPQIIAVGEPRIDAAVAIQFKDAMRAALSSEAGRVILDLSQVEFIDSSGLGAVVAVKKAMPPPQRLDLAGLTPMVDKLFRLTRMDTIFALYPTLAEAEVAQAPLGAQRSPVDGSEG